MKLFISYVVTGKNITQTFGNAILTYDNKHSDEIDGEFIEQITEDLKNELKDKLKQVDNPHLVILYYKVI